MFFEKFLFLMFLPFIYHFDSFWIVLELILILYELCDIFIVFLLTFIILIRINFFYDWIFTVFYSFKFLMLPKFYNTIVNLNLVNFYSFLNFSLSFFLNSWGSFKKKFF